MMLDALDGRGAARELPPTPARQAPSGLPDGPAPSPAATAFLPGGRPCRPRRVITAQPRTVVVTAQTVRRRATYSTVAGTPC